jgi:hypothetical protein
MRRRIDAAIESAWHELDGYCETAEEASTINMQFGELASTYGEVTVEGAREILHALQLHFQHDAAPHNPEPASGAGGVVFVDLGSGVGKMVALAALECEGIRRSIGVELCSTRHQRATLACERLGACLSPEHHQRCQCIELTNGNMLEALEPIGAATHVYVSSLLFNEETMKQLAILLDAAPHILCIGSLQEFPPGTLQSFAECGSVTAKMDWSKDAEQGSEVFIYRRQKAAESKI